MKKLDPQAYRSMPWKNGLGTTTEVLTLPPGATLDTFLARVSLAGVTHDGPFSHFDGVDRTLVVTHGNGLTLALADGAAIHLDVTSRPFAFTGEDACHATLTAGPIRDLNVMTRRSAFRHRAVRVVLSEDRTLLCTGELTFLAVLSGSLVAADEGGEVALRAGDHLTLAPAEPFVVLRGKTDGAAAEVLLVEFVRR